MFRCICMERFDIILIMEIALFMPASGKKPNCSFLRSGCIDFLALAIKTLKRIFVSWLIKLMVLCNSHLAATSFFGNVIMIDMLRSEGIFSLSYISFSTLETFCFPMSSSYLIISMQMQSGPAALFTFSLEIAAFTTLARIPCPSIVSGCVVFLLLYNRITHQRI